MQNFGKQLKVSGQSMAERHIILTATIQSMLNKGYTGVTESTVHSDEEHKQVATDYLKLGIRFWKHIPKYHRACVELLHSIQSGVKSS